MTFVDRPVKGLRVDQVPQQGGGGASEAAPGQQAPQRVLPPGEREDTCHWLAPAFDNVEVFGKIEAERLEYAYVCLGFPNVRGVQSVILIRYIKY